MQSLETRVFEYRGPRTSNNYNKFFNPNICHICKSTESNLIPCDRCYLISYCNEEHKQLHYEEHAKFCNNITRFTAISPPTNKGGFAEYSLWKKIRESILNTIKRNMNEPLATYMEDMILFAKSCIFCHQQVELACCQRCFSANYCVRHVDDFHMEHDENECKRLTLLINMNLEYIAGHITDDFSYEFLWLLDQNNNFINMNNFCTQYVLNTRKSEHLLAKDYFQSYYFSEPLTVYYELFLQDLFYFIYRRSYVIHIIATKYTNKYENNLGAWELFIHLSGIKKLTIVIIGLNMENSNSYSFSRLCERCRADGKQLHLIYKSLLYHEYMVESKTSKQCLDMPNIITAFEITLNRYEAVAKYITIIQKLSCPLLLTSASRRVIEANIDFIERVLRITISSRSNLNCFAGLLPRQDWEIGRTTLYNKYTFICKNLRGDIA